MPGTWTFTYWPGKKESAPAPSREKAMVVSDRRSTAPRRAWKACPLVLQTSDDAKMSTTTSVFGRIWQASAKPSAASSSVNASSM